MQELSDFAGHLADEAGAIIRQYFRASVAVDVKDDATPVTVADRKVEERLRALIERDHPDDAILGEEFGTKEGRSGRTWVLDPIDGTKSFIVGRPTFGTLIALWDGDAPLLGIIDQPISKERWIGDGTTTTLNGARVRTRACAAVKEAVAACTSPRQIETLWPRLYDSCKAMVWGGDCYSYGLLASGFLDISVESGLKPYDFAALVPVVTGAGGWMGDWRGAPLTLASDGRALALGDGRLKEPFLKML